MVIGISHSCGCQTGCIEEHTVLCNTYPHCDMGLNMKRVNPESWQFQVDLIKYLKKR